MIKSCITIAWRNLIRNRSFSAINILGLAVGMTGSLLIFLWINDEKRVDNFHVNKEYLYQVYERQHYDGKTDAGYTTQGLLASELKRVIPEIKYSSGMESAAAPGAANTFETGGKTAKMNGFYAENDFLKMFSYPLLQGNKEKTIVDVGDIAISRSMASYFFGTPENAIGKTIRFDNQENLMVTTVFENPPSGSSQQFDFLRSWNAFIKQNAWANNWGNSDPATFIQLQAGADPGKVRGEIKDFIYRYIPKGKTSSLELDIQQFSEKYLHSSFVNGSPDGGRIYYVHIFTWIAVLILLIACVNFMNLATARSVKRAKEVGLRKVIGAMPSVLIVQFIAEAIMIALFSVLIGIALAAILLPSFNELTGKKIVIPFHEYKFWLNIAVVTVITGLVAGSYPAFFLSSLKPVKVLKGVLKFSSGSILFRQGLVTFQFALSIILVACMIIVYRQMNFIQTKNIGYDRENLVYIPIEGELINQYELFKSEAAKVPGITAISKMRNSPTVIEHHTGGVSWEGKDPRMQISFADGVVGYDFTKTLGLRFAEGRDFSTDYPSDSTKFLLNETAVGQMGIQKPLGQMIEWNGRRGEVLGVLRDFHSNSLHQNIEPLILRLDEKWGWGTILVRVRSKDMQHVLNDLEKISKTLNPAFPFTYQFSDDEFAKLYISEMIIGKLTRYFAILAVFISCLGLFGLATLTASQRVKEIGVRKVLGASVSGLVVLLTKQFLRPVILAIFISTPVAYGIAQRWLNTFAYKIDPDWKTFAFAGLAGLAVASITVSFQSFQTARLNPSQSLKSDD